MSAAPQQEHQDQATEPLPTEPGHIMRREHYERMAREADQQK